MSFEQLHTSISLALGHPDSPKPYSPKHHAILMAWVGDVINDYRKTFFDTYILDWENINVLQTIILEYTDALINKILKTRHVANPIIQLVGCGALIVAIQHILAVDWMGQDESGLHRHLVHMCANTYTCKQIDDMGTCIHRMFDFLPHVTLKDPKNQGIIDDLFLMNMKEETDLAERERTHKHALELTKHNIARVTRRILLEKRRVRRHRLATKKRKMLRRKRANKSRRFFWKNHQR